MSSSAKIFLKILITLFCEDFDKSVYLSTSPVYYFQICFGAFKDNLIPTEKAVIRKIFVWYVYNFFVYVLTAYGCTQRRC